MQPDSIFQACSGLAMAGWLILILFPYSRRLHGMLVGVVITLLAVVYTGLIFSGFHPADLSKFGTLKGVMDLFRDPWLVTAGWVHYLAFDLFVGTWMKKNAVYHGITVWLLVPCLIFTFLLGPFGLLLYLFIRWLITKTYFAKN